MSKFVRLCPVCKSKSNEDSCLATCGYSTYLEENNNICEICGSKVIDLKMLSVDYKILTSISNDTNFIESMIELHDTDIIEYESKMSQFRNQVSQKEQHSNIPKCPTCNSTNIQKISGTKRFVTTGLFGLASSNVGKTMECKNCGAKW